MGTIPETDRKQAWTDYLQGGARLGKGRVFAPQG
jgi:hypothetical protein